MLCTHAKDACWDGFRAAPAAPYTGVNFTYTKWSLSLKESLTILMMSFFPFLAFAAEQAERSIWQKLFVALFPILIIIAAFGFFMKIAKKDTQSMQQKLLDSNLEIAKQLKRIADHVDEKS